MLSKKMLFPIYFSLKKKKNLVRVIVERFDSNTGKKIGGKNHRNNKRSYILLVSIY